MSAVELDVVVPAEFVEVVAESVVAVAKGDQVDIAHLSITLLKQ